MLKRCFRRSSRALQADSPMGNTAAPFFIPVLCYHSGAISGISYETNDHVALEQDLKLLARRGYQILPATDLVAILQGKIPRKKLSGKRLVCITCDDGRDLDYHEYNNDRWGTVPSFHAILQRSKKWLPQFLHGPRAVSFVIASTKYRWRGRTPVPGKLSTPAR